MRKFLTEQFLQKYEGVNPFPTEIGEFTYTRTYAPYLPDKKRREIWKETCERVVEYSCNLGQSTRQEAEKLYDNIFYLRQFPSGRTLWVGGRGVSMAYPMSNFSCSFSVIDNLKAIPNLFYLALVGCGIGFRALKTDVEKLPSFRQDIDVYVDDKSTVSSIARQEYTGLEINFDEAKIVVGDSKNAWVKAIEFFLELLTSPHYTGIQQITLDVNNVRPRGERLKQFGGFASGAEPLTNFVIKFNEIVKRNSFDGKLEPIEIIDAMNLLGESVVAGGVRRIAEIALIDPYDTKSIDMKSHLYTQIDGNWVLDKNISHRQLSNNSIFYTSKPTRERLHWQIEKMRYSGEPAWVNQEQASKRRINFEGVNPCFTGDMKLLTSEGYKTFESLDGKQVQLINHLGDVTNGKVWKSGNKEIVEVVISDGTIIRCTDNHIFMTDDGRPNMAKDLSGRYLTRYVAPQSKLDDEYIKYGFIQGDGALGRLTSETHKGLEVYIGKDDGDVGKLFGVEYDPDIKGHYLTGFNEKLKELGFDGRNLTERTLPTTYYDWTYQQRASFLRGLFSANGGVVGNSRVSFKATSRGLIEGLQDALEMFNIETYVTTNKAKEVDFSNRTYLCKESYDLNIGRIESLRIFAREIGFVHEYKQESLKKVLCRKGNYVVKVNYTGEFEDVYDFTEPETHWGVVEGVVVHNCAEILLNKNGLCNLTEVNVASFVEDGEIKLLDLLEAQRLSTRMGVRMTIPTLELHEFDLVNKEERLIGCSLTGWQDAVELANLSEQDQINLLRRLKDVAREEADRYANELGINSPLLTTTIKPSGTLSLLPTVSSGIHRNHSEYYIRRIRVNADDPLAHTVRELGYKWEPEVGQDMENLRTIVVEFPVKGVANNVKANVSAIQQLKDYIMFMEHYVEHNASISVHVRDHEWDEVEQFVWDNWDKIVAVSFIPYDDSFYQLLPYEECTKEEYLELKRITPKFDPLVLAKYDQGEEFGLDDSECASGVCPIK